MFKTCSGNGQKSVVIVILNTAFQCQNIDGSNNSNDNPAINNRVDDIGQDKGFNWGSLECGIGGNINDTLFGIDFGLYDPEVNESLIAPDT